MDQALINYLEKLELSESEAKLYLTILSDNGKTVRELAQILGINRSTAFVNTERLIEKELVMKIIKDSKTLIIPNEPKLILKNLVDKQIKSAKTIQEQLPNITNELQKKYLPFEKLKHAEVKYYKGKLGVKKIYEDALKEKILCSYANQAIMHDALPDNMELFEDAIKNNKNIKIFEIVEDSTSSRREVELQSKDIKYKRLFYRLLPKDVKLSAADTLIYNNKVAIINVGKQITGVVLHNSDYYKNTKAIFDSYWNMLSNPYSMNKSTP
jgi:sugar-specific transcriptional regulator TrmB